MKHLCKLIFLVTALSLAVGCHHDQQAEEVITCAQQLLETRPDSALAILDSIRDLKDNWPRSQRMHYELVYAQAQNKAFVSITTDSILLEVADYYNCHGTDNQRMMANYIVGCAYRDMGDAPSALKYMNLAVDAVNQNDKDCDLATLMRIHSQMGGLYQGMGAYNDALAEDMSAEILAWATKDTISAIHLMWLRACSYADLNIRAKSKEILDSIILLTKENHLEEEPILIYPIMIDQYLILQDTITAEKLLCEYELKTGMNPYVQDSEYIDISYFNRKGQIYLLHNQPDSAIVMFNRMNTIAHLRNLSNAELFDFMVATYSGLKDAYNIKHQNDSSVKYADLSCHLIDSLYKHRNSEGLLKMQSLYNYTKVQDRALYLQHKSTLLYLLLIIIVSITIIASIITYTIYQRRMQVNRQVLADSNREYQSLMEQFNKSTFELSELQSNIDSFLQTKELEINKLEEALSTYQNGVVDMEQWNDERNLFNCDISKHLHKLASKGQQATPSELENLKQIVNTSFSDFNSVVVKNEKNLSKLEISICALIRLRFITSEIAILTGLSSQRLTNHKSALNKKLFGITGAKTLEQHLLKLK